MSNKRIYHELPQAMYNICLIHTKYGRWHRLIAWGWEGGTPIPWVGQWYFSRR